LVFAKLAGYSNPQQALRLAGEAVDKDPENPQVLVGAHMVGVAAGRDDFAMPLVAKAASLSRGGDGIHTLSHRELIEFMQANAESWQRKNALFRSGAMPIHMAAATFNMPLAQLLVGIPRSNASEADPRRRQFVPIRSGARGVVDAAAFRRIALDISSIYLASELGVLRDILDRFDAVFISPRTMEV
jgi:hypothetical protein